MPESRGENIHLLKIGEVAELFGVTEGTVRQWMRTQGLPYVRLGRTIRFRTSDIDAWLTKRTRGGDDDVRIISKATAG